MNDREHAERLLQMASKDLKALQGMADAEAFDDEIFGFHAQQAVEKALKAWIAALGKRFPKTHDIEDLIEVLESNSQDIQEDVLTLVSLYPFAVQYRYETLDTEDEPLNREDVLRSVVSLIDRVQRFVK
jgi:HEPN domain-containing protein